MIIKAASVKEAKRDELKRLVESFPTKPKLSIIMIGESSASKVYVRNKMKFAEELGVETNLIHLDEEIKEEEVFRIIDEENNNPETNGLFVQLPIPKHINEKKLIEAIDATKDVDGFTYDNIGKLFVGDETGLFPCTVEGIIDILDHYKIDIQGKNVVIVGRSNIVGKPMALRLINMGATVTVCNSKTKNIKGFIDNCDIFISAIGVAKFFKGEHFVDSKDVTVIDVGMNRDEEGKLCGDVDLESVEDKVLNITPVPGGVGVMTVVRVIGNVIKAYQNQNNL